MRSIAKLFQISATAVLYWIRDFAKKYNFKSTKKRIKAVEIDEMWQYISKKKKNIGHSKLLIELTENCSLSSVAIEHQKL